MGRFKDFIHSSNDDYEDESDYKKRDSKRGKPSWKDQARTKRKERDSAYDDE